MTPCNQRLAATGQPGSWDVAIHATSLSSCPNSSSRSVVRYLHRLRRRVHTQPAVNRRVVIRHAEDGRFGLALVEAPILLGSGEPSCGPCLTGAFSLSSFLYVTIWVTFLGSVCGAVNFVRPSVLPHVLGVPKWSFVPPPSRAEPWRRIDQVEWRLDMGLPGFGPCGASVQQRRRRRS
jgi:hypothetical protein